ncbi:DUF5677 domain-containing protein [Cupriavidus necator]
MKITTLLPGATSNTALVASALFARVVAHFQGAILGEHRQKLTAFAQEHAGAAELTLFELARKAGMLDLYNAFYRHLSHNAAHPSITATGLYFIDDGEQDGHIAFRFVPEDTPKAMICTCLAMLVACGAYERPGSTTPEINAGLTGLLDRFAALDSRYVTWDRDGDIRPSTLG